MTDQTRWPVDRLAAIVQGLEPRFTQYDCKRVADLWASELRHGDKLAKSNGHKGPHHYQFPLTSKLVKRLRREVGA